MLFFVVCGVLMDVDVDVDLCVCVFEIMCDECGVGDDVN